MQQNERTWGGKGEVLGVTQGDGGELGGWTGLRYIVYMYKVVENDKIDSNFLKQDKMAILGC